MLPFDMRFDGRDALLIFIGFSAWFGVVPAVPKGLPLAQALFVVVAGFLPMSLPFVRRWLLGPPARRLLRHGRWWSWVSMGSLVLFSAGGFAMFLASLVAYRLSVEPASPFDFGAQWHQREEGLPWLAGAIGTGLVLAFLGFLGLESRYQKLSP